MSALTTAINRVFSMVILPLRAWIRWLRTEAPQVSFASRLTRTVLMFPAFALLLALLRIRMFVRNPILVDIVTISGDRFRCHPPDLIQLYLWIFGVWEPDLTAFIGRRLKPGETFVDVGANIGYYTVMAARGVGPHGTVVAIEASPAVFTALEESLAANPACGNVRAINNAAAAAPGVMNVYAGPQHNTGLTSTVKRQGLTRQSQVEALPLDDLLTPDELKNARMIKIDVEGGEDQVLAGMASLIREGRRDLEILVELSPQWWGDSSTRPIDVLQPFLDAGFHLYMIENNYWFWRYLWPRRVRQPWRAHLDLTERVRRLDLVLSRIDSPTL